MNEIMKIVTEWTTRNTDKVFHYAYGTLFYLPGYFIYGIIGGLITCFTAGVLIELLQMKDPDRQADWKDVVATLLGGLVMAL